jgi:hypothetical protein
MSFIMRTLAFVGATVKYIFRNKDSKSFKEVYFDECFSESYFTGYSGKNADFGFVIVVVVIILSLLFNYSGCSLQSTIRDLHK